MLIWVEHAFFLIISRPVFGISIKVRLYYHWILLAGTSLCFYHVFLQRYPYYETCIVTCAQHSLRSALVPVCNIAWDLNCRLCAASPEICIVPCAPHRFRPTLSPVRNIAWDLHCRLCAISPETYIVACAQYRLKPAFTPLRNIVWDLHYRLCANSPETCIVACAITPIFRGAGTFIEMVFINWMK